MLKSKKNMHAEKNATTSKFGQFLLIKMVHFGSKSAQNKSKMKPGVIFVFIIMFKI
jgi:hypothetical protein